MTITETAQHEMREALAPHPWKIEDHTSTHHGYEGGYLSIVDAAGLRVCDFFPFAGKDGRGKEATLALARLIIEWERARATARD